MKKRRTPQENLTLALYEMIGFLVWGIFVDWQVYSLVFAAGFFVLFYAGVVIYKGK
jgi:hypothetical protein